MLLAWLNFKDVLKKSVGKFAKMPRKKHHHREKNYFVDFVHRHTRTKIKTITNTNTNTNTNTQTQTQTEEQQERTKR